MTCEGARRFGISWMLTGNELLLGATLVEDVKSGCWRVATSLNMGLVWTRNDVELSRKSIGVPLDWAFIKPSHHVLVFIKEGAALRGVFPAVQLA